MSEGKRHEVRLRMEPVPADVRQVYERRGIPVPAASSSYSPAATWPPHPRLAHRAYAFMAGYFWLPCVLCGREFGGHEITESIPDPTKGEGWSMAICPFCAAERNDGTP